MPAPLHSLASAHTLGDLAKLRKKQPCTVSTASGVLFPLCVVKATYNNEPDPSEVEGHFAPKLVGEPANVGESELRASADWIPWPSGAEMAEEHIRVGRRSRTSARLSCLNMVQSEVSEAL